VDGTTLNYSQDRQRIVNADCTITAITPNQQQQPSRGHAPQQRATPNQPIKLSKLATGKRQRSGAMKTPGAAAPTKPRKHKATKKRPAKLSQQMRNFFQPQPKPTTDKGTSNSLNIPPRYKPPPAPSAEQSQTGIEPLARLTVTTLNVQGLLTSKMNVRDITLGKYGPVPDILILTETKSKPTHAR
jgi:hypothetical protein